MLSFWKRPVKPRAKTPAPDADVVKAAVAPKYETFLARARRNDSDGRQRRIRQVIDQNRLL